MDSAPQSRLIGPLGRYVLYDAIAAGGMATVHLARLHGAAGFSRVVAIKRLHSNYASDPEYVAMFLAEARLAARIKHPNVVSTLDVVAEEGEVFLVMEFVLGESLERLMPKTGEAPMPARVAVSLVCGLLEGLHAAHEAKNDQGETTPIVHRDVSPHNVIVGQDGVPRLFDFGIAKASDYARDTREGVIKGKAAYMAPEQLLGTVDVRSDLFATGVVLWELLAGRRLHAGRRNNELFLELATKKLAAPPALGTLRDDVPEGVDAIIARATAIEPGARFSSAREMTLALEAALAPAPARDVATWLDRVSDAHMDELAAAARRIAADGERTESSVVAPWPVPNVTAADGGSVTGSGVGVISRSVRAPSIHNSVAPLAGHTSSVSSSVNVVPPSRHRWTVAVALVAVAIVAFVGLRAVPHAKVDVPTAGTEGSPPAVSGATTLTGTGGERERTTPDAIPSASSPSALPSVPSTVEAGAEATGHPTKAAAPTNATPRRTTFAPYVAPRAPAPSAAPSPAASTKPAAPAAKPSCDNPFFIGADGIRQIKPECM